MAIIDMYLSSLRKKNNKRNKIIIYNINSVLLENTKIVILNTHFICSVCQPQQQMSYYS